MKTNQSRFQKCHTAILRHGHAAWMLVRNRVCRRLAGGGVTSNAVTEDAPVLCLNPLDRIKEHLCRLGLGQQVRVRFETASEDFVLEDDDGYVHAKDYAEAVLVIERIWLYRA